MPPASPTPAPPQDPADGAGRPREKKSRWQRLRSQRWWPWAVTLVSGAFVVFVITLLVRQARNVDWGAVWEAFLALPTPTLLTAAALALASHAIYGTFDLFGRYFTRHGLSVGRTMGITLIAYPFTLNLGSIIGGVSVRYRLYSRQGVSVGAIGQVIGQSIVTNWLGYFVLAGAVFWMWSPKLPEGWHVGPQELRWAGTALAALTVAYVAACAVRRGRPIAWRGHDFPLPDWRVALLQVAVSTVNWAVMGGAVWVLAGRDTPYAAALATVLLGAVAGLVSRIPAGLGVLEAVGTAVLSAYIPTSQALAAVLAYRALYFFAPLVLAALAFGAVEWFGRGAPAKSGDGAEAEENADAEPSGNAPAKASRKVPA